MSYQWWQWLTPEPYQEFLQRELIEKNVERIANAFGANTARQQNEFNAEQAALANDRTRENMELQKQLNLDLSRESYAAMVNGMESAGLNSALAYSHSPNVGSVGLGTSQTARAASEGVNFLKLLAPLVNKSLSIAGAAIQATSAKSPFYVYQRHKYTKKDLTDVNTSVADFLKK